MPGHHRIADVELGGQPAAFAKADITTINVNLEIGFYAVEFNQGLFVLPAVRQGEKALIRAGRVIGGHPGHINREGETFIGILQLAVAFHLPHGWHGDRAPVGHIFRGKVFRYQQRVGEKAKIPLAA